MLGNGLEEVSSMQSAVNESPVWVPGNEAERNLVRQQMNRLLETSHFKNSRRYPALLRFIVEETLEGRGEFLKERLLGIRVFDRPADYDTAADPIVRVTIAEIRKRIAQYYHEEAHDLEMRIELLPGRYEPEFRPRKKMQPEHPSHVPRSADTPPEAIAAVESPAPSVAASESGLISKTRRSHSILRYVLAAAAILILSAAGAFLWQSSHGSALDEFWGPVLATHRAVTFCIPNGAGRSMLGDTKIAVRTLAARSATANPSFLEHESLGENVVFSDTLATLKISNLLAAHNRDSRFRLNVATTLDDLRQGPSVLVGGMDNEWTLRAIAPLRFRFAGSDEESYWVEDAKAPEKRDWALDLKTPYEGVTRDYAIIARVHDAATGQIDVIVAGIGMSGTAAAGEFLVDPLLLEELRKTVGPGFRDHDFEAILSTDVVNGISGKPHILAVAVR